MVGYHLEQTFEIIDGLRRAKAADLVGHTTIIAQNKHD